MLAIFLKTLPFFALIATGWAAARLRFFPPEASGWLTRFVFYFALSAMLFRLAATLDIGALFDARFGAAYLLGSGAVWIAGFAAARLRGAETAAAAMQAHTGMTGNTGFLGVPMLLLLLGQRAVGPVLMVMAIYMIVFSTVITLIVTAARHGRVGVGTILPLARGLVANPMIVSMAAGVTWSMLRLPLPAPVAEYLSILGGAATPGALFAIGASLAHRAVRDPGPALRLSFAKLILHPACSAAACWALGVDPASAGVMIAAAALPVAGTVYILAHHFAVAEESVSAAILLSTAAGILTLPIVIHLIPG